MLHTIPLGIVSSTAAAYLLEQSLLFNPADSAHFSRTPSSTGDVKTWTFSAWVKFAIGTNYNMLMGHRRDGGGASTQTQVVRSSSGALMFFNSLSGSIDANLSTEALFRDTSAWYHIVYIVNTTESTDTDRVKIIVNGVQQTIAAGADWPALNATTRFNEASRFMYVGALNDAADNPYLFHNGLMAEVNFVDGTAVAATNFGEEDDDGFWNPIEYTGSYGTNGFQLKFADTSAFGDDTSGNTNDYTSNNFTASDKLEDSPTSSAGDGIGNYITLNPNDRNNTSLVLTEGNTYLTASGDGGIKGTIFVDSGEHHFEYVAVSTTTNNMSVGITLATSSLTNETPTTGDYAFNIRNGTEGGRAYDIFANGVTIATGSLPAAPNGKNIGVVFDADAGTLKFYNSDLAASGDLIYTISSIPAGSYTVLARSSNNTHIFDFNFGQRPFVDTNLNNANAIATQNLPAPTIADGSQHFNTVLWTGDGTSPKKITTEFAPDFIWIKNRTDGAGHQLFDTLRDSGTEPYLLASDSTAAETVSGRYLANLASNAFDTDGFNLSSTGNVSAKEYVAWCWKAGGAASSNTDGSITSSVSANTTSGFSIVSYTGTGSNGTIGHGLGVTPSFYIVKNRDTGSASWICYHTFLGATKGIKLEEAGTPSTNPLFFNNTEPTSSVFTVGTHGDTNTNTDNYIAYCWSEVEGFSKFGSYTGNGSADGPFVYTGFRPAFVMTKRTNSSGDWRMHDTTRVPYNPFDGYLRASTTNAELSGGDFDFLSNGFKIRNNGGEINASGGAFIYMAFAEHPFQGAGGVTQARAR